jgi:hypothetical protein
MNFARRSASDVPSLSSPASIPRRSSRDRFWPSLNLPSIFSMGISNATIAPATCRGSQGQVFRAPGRRFFQNLIGAFQLAILALQLLQSLPLVAGQARALSGPAPPDAPIGAASQSCIPACRRSYAIAAHCDGCSAPCSRTIRPRAHVLRGSTYLLVPWAPSSQRMDPPTIPVRFKVVFYRR